MSNGGYPPAKKCCCEAPKYVHITFKNNWIGNVNVYNAACSGGYGGGPVTFEFGGDQTNKATAVQIEGDTFQINVADDGGTNLGNDNTDINSIGISQSNQQ
ncbi:hypothetical protein [Pseudobacillus wudalianchiensis]|uniref:Uncharacterized protein n=1 Tax=Pseudobacillus wudalianchiensis TaxID=1743143 RepID=A0A1B9B8C1_9BACI|nr:hypothetical protein [Bacillus wudalianchiensis]OCA92328.1 hypothetical protein A8F95_00990 [Bacillus wudalianchiensis]